MSHKAEKNRTESEWNVEQHSKENQEIKQLSFGAWLKAGGNERMDLTLSRLMLTKETEKSEANESTNLNQLLGFLLSYISIIGFSLLSSLVNVY